MRVLITGAHFTPAVATAESLKKYKNVNIIYIGRKTTREGDPSPSVESQVFPKLGIRFMPIITGRFQKDFTIFTIPSLLKIPIGFLQAFYFIYREKPDVILSFGGYVAVPIVFVGWLFSIPIIIHNQTLVSGLANKISSLFADKIALSFKNGKDHKKVVVTGNPIREIILLKEKKISLSTEYLKIFEYSHRKKLPVILITGGNQGSHTINKTVEKSIKTLTELSCIIHITGDNKFKDFTRLSKLRNENYLAKVWIDREYGEILSRIDLVVSRAGMNTLSELAYLGKPALVIPLPYLYKDEQTVNAKYFERLNLVKILPQSKLSAGSLVREIKQMLKNLTKLKQKAKMARQVIIPDATERLALEVILLGKQNDIDKKE